MALFLHNTKIGVPIIDSIPHCHTENALKKRQKSRNVASLLYRGQLPYYIEDKVEECIIDSIPHCHTENALKRGKNQEMWLHCYIEDGLFTI